MRSNISNNVADVVSEMNQRLQFGQNLFSKSGLNNTIPYCIGLSGFALYDLAATKR